MPLGIGRRGLSISWRLVKEKRRRALVGEILEWVMGNTYNTGDRVMHQGSAWESTVDANVTEPGSLAGALAWEELP